MESRTDQIGSDTRLAKISGIPHRRLGDTFGTFDLFKNPEMREPMEQCLAVAKGEARSALLAGRPGNGKTHLAIAAMHEYGMARSFFWKVPEFLDWLRDHAYGNEARYSIEFLTRSYRYDDILLVMDDLGTENSTDWAHEQLYRVLDARYDNELPTVITTNRDQKHLDARLLSRYAEGLVVCKGADLRRSR